MELETVSALLPDYHIHTPFCKHASGRMEEYVERAIELGIEEIGFSDHMPVMPEPQFCMDYDDLKRYIGRVRELQRLYDGRITIRLGCEMDIEFDMLDEIRRIIEENDFDYVIGSIHYLEGWPFDQVKYRDVFEKENIEQIYERFFDTIIRAAKTGLYDITGHIDNIKRMGFRPGKDIGNLFNNVATVLKSMNCAVEINTSGIDTDAGEPYPSPDFLRVLQRYDIPITLGSDAHSPGQVGRYFDRALEYISEAGYDRVAFFDKRKRILKKIGGQTGRSRQ